jgi:DNA-directed RNA polymerase specialized sigma24 family protein
VNGNPILSLDPGARVAFVLHHLFGYNIEQSASLVETDEKRFRARLRSAYVQLASEQLMRDAHLIDIREQYAVV